ncbi:MAG: NapC/NirT family cytochrome c, partial [Gammaproteobacteria bacterium]|nr:NapC/NirT family cytochrome c [Gammaproteobacteria bacterium]
MANQKPVFGLMSRKVLLGTTFGAALFFMIVGVIFWGGFNTAMEATNTLTFCISCHEMEENVYREYQETVHFTNRSGVRATCSDCHVPDPWVHKVVRKVQASRELVHKALGTIDTPEKFDNKRLQLAKNVWHAMKKTDSRECRNCHDFDSMNPENQKGRARKQHINAMEAGNTCIDCHKGIAHKEVHDLLTDDELDEIEKPDPDNIRPIPPQWLAYTEQGARDSKNEAAAEAPVETAAEPAADTDAQAPEETAAEPAADTDAQAPEETAAEPAADTDAQASAETAAEPVVAAATATAAAASTSSGPGIDWSGVEPVEITLFYPGHSSMEWILKGSDHSGKRAFDSGDRCFDCHEDEEVDIGDLVTSGKKLETDPITGKRGSIPVNIQAAHDNEYLYMRFQWADGKHAPATFAKGGKMDPENQIKLALMLATDKVEYADRAGCWQTCHIDASSMPLAPDAGTLGGSPLAGSMDFSNGVTKYLKESRTDIEIEGKDGKTRGGWDKLKQASEIQAALKNGQFMDLLRYKSGTGESEDGYILAERVMTGGQGVEFSGNLSGGTWTVEMKRKLASSKPGDISMATDQTYNIGFALHD